MKVYAISDLHLSGHDTKKPMDIFGGDWTDYVERIKADWQSRVTDDDVVLIAGDISWAMELDEAMCDLDFLGALKGKKVLVRGNHDYWWKSISQIRSRIMPSMYCLQNDSVKLGNVVFAGTRGWTIPETNAKQEDIVIYNREVERLRLSLKSAAAKMTADDTLICLMHYPPLGGKGESTGFSDLFLEYGVKKVVFGHLHGAYIKTPLIQEKDGVEYYLTSCDKLLHKLVAIF